MKTISSKRYGEYAIMAIADGHGAKIHDLSDRGAKIAVHSALLLLTQFIHNFGSNDVLLYKNIKSDFPSRYVRLWNMSVSRYHSQSFGEDLGSYVRYGTTAMFAVVHNNSAIVGKLGDGNICVRTEDIGYPPYSVHDAAPSPVENSGMMTLPDGLIYELLLSEDLGGVATYSMASKYPAGLFQITHVRHMTLLTLSTDGLINCFSTDEQFYGAVRTIDDMISTDQSRFLSALPSFLTYCTNNGSADDVTLAVIKVLNKRW